MIHFLLMQVPLPIPVEEVPSLFSIALQFAANAPMTAAVIWLIVRFGGFMNQQRDFFFGKEGYVTKRDEIMIATLKEASASQRELANQLHALCRFRG